MLKLTLYASDPGAFGGENFFPDATFHITSLDTRLLACFDPTMFPKVTPLCISPPLTPEAIPERTNVVMHIWYGEKLMVVDFHTGRFGVPLTFVTANQIAQLEIPESDDTIRYHIAAIQAYMRALPADAPVILHWNQ